MPTTDVTAERWKHLQDAVRTWGPLLGPLARPGNRTTNDVAIADLHHRLFATA